MMTNKPKLSQFMPILLNFDQASNPVGYVDLADEHCILKVNTKLQKVKVDDLNAGKVAFAPSYIVTKADKDGNIQEIVVDSFSLITKL